MFVDPQAQPLAFRPRKVGLQIPPSDPGKRPGQDEQRL